MFKLNSINTSISILCTMYIKLTLTKHNKTIFESHFLGWLPFPDILCKNQFLKKTFPSPDGQFCHFFFHIQEAPSNIQFVTPAPQIIDLERKFLSTSFGDGTYALVLPGHTVSTWEQSSIEDDVKFSRSFLKRVQITVLQGCAPVCRWQSLNALQNMSMTHEWLKNIVHDL